MKNKKSQIQMGENVLILFIFFLLLIFAIVFYTRIQSSSTQQKIEQDVTGMGLDIAQKVAFLPEVQCTKDNAEVFSGCYDVYSVKALNNLASQNKEYYYDLFGFSKITINKIFPDEETFVIYDGSKVDFKSITTTNVPVPLCDFSGKMLCTFAVLKIEVYN